MDDRDLDFGLALADQLDRERAARRDARSACNTQGNRSENCCVQEKTLGKLLRAASGSTRRPGVSLTRRERLAAKLTGMTRAASDVGEGYSNKLGKTGNGTLPILEDVGGGEDENVKVAKGDAFRFKGICLMGIYLRVFNSFESRIQLFFLGHGLTKLQL